MENKKGVVFDFNGTLFWDTQLQNDSWDQFLAKYNFNLSDEEKLTWVHGINAKDTFEYLFKKELSAEEVDLYTEEKEVIYRAMCLEKGMELAPGALDFISFLVNNGVEIAIATASAKNNVDFFIENFHLLNYFKPENIIYNDGSTRGKPFPDLFNKAIERLNTDKKNTTIFEDSKAGIKAAVNAGAGNVIIVSEINNGIRNAHFQVIHHFDEVNREHFLDK
ncbi:HAD family phosphatase [uncultured Draconibacterium sp.]|uniref:HAD family hydrolase n=1 Tax=uncultured Draconibacterium sp. TaxID=1573823 RepID=UPI0032180599